MEEKRHRVNKHDRSNLLCDLWGAEELCSNHASVTSHGQCQHRQIEMECKWREKTHECDTRTNFSHPCTFNVRRTSLHISSFDIASAVILELTDIISIAIIPTCPSNESSPSLALRSAKKFIYG